ncbi:MAG: DUF1156 domain-containing protein [Candidatus Bathyarchaeia archaeon]
MGEVEGTELLISKWFPITEISVESVRERSTGHNPPTSRIHVWFARRPHATSRAAVLGSLLPTDFEKEDFLRLLGIPIGVDVQKAEDEVTKAKAAGIHLNYNPFFWDKAYRYMPSGCELEKLHGVLREFWDVERPLVVDPMAGGGSIPFEAMRLGLHVVAGDLNPVAFLCLKGTLEYPVKFGKRLLAAVEKFCREVHEAAKHELEEFFPKQPGEKVYAYLWARTIRCSICGLVIPLSPNWWISRTDKDEESMAVRLVVPEKVDVCGFEIVSSPKKRGLNPDKGTVKGGSAECPRCWTVIDGEEVKRIAQKGQMGHQLYCVCVKNRGLNKKKAKWDFRAPTKQENEAVEKAKKRLKEKLPEWENKNNEPNEEYFKGFSDRCSVYGVRKWSDLFNPRQLLTHMTYLESFQQAKKQLFADAKEGSEEWEFAAAVATYGAMVFDTSVNYNCVLSRWHFRRTLISPMMELQAFPFKWSYAEWNQLVPNGGYDWALSKVLDALKEIVELLPENPPQPVVYCGSATAIPLKDKCSMHSC